MENKRDWAKDVEGTDVKFIEKIGDYIYCEYLGFIFKIHRTSWPVTRFSPNNCTTPNEFFKFQVKQIHGNLYNLDKTVYQGADNKTTAECKIHGEFSIDAKYFKSFRGCPACGNKCSSDSTRLSTEEFIVKAKEIHGDKYDYSKVDYISAKTDVIVICKVHGEFKTKPTNHLSSKGCRKCANVLTGLRRSLNQDEVIRRFINKHGSRYDYSKVNYSGDAHALLDIVCKEHGLFTQSYANHNSGKGCPICAKEFNSRLKSGFVKSANSKSYASLYLIKCYDSDEEFYKIGITTKPIRYRFGGKSQIPYEYNLIHLHCSDGESIWELEKILHREYRDIKYIPALEFGGRYECFSDIDVDEYKKLLEIIG